MKSITLLEPRPSFVPELWPIFNCDRQIPGSKCWAGSTAGRIYFSAIDPRADNARELLAGIEEAGAWKVIYATQAELDRYIKAEAVKCGRAPEELNKDLFRERFLAERYGFYRRGRKKLSAGKPRKLLTMTVCQDRLDRLDAICKERGISRGRLFDEMADKCYPARNRDDVFGHPDDEDVFA